MANRTFSSSSYSLKAANVILFLVLILHIIGFSIPKWIIVEFNIGSGRSISTSTESGYHAGLWQHCSCVNVFDSGVCLCFSRTNDPAWFKVVQTAETLGLIGLIVSMFLSLTLMCYKQNKKYKIINLLLVPISGALILIGVAVYAIKAQDMKKGFEDMDNYLDEVEFKGGYGELSYAFMLCAVAACLCIVVCTPLFMKDMCSPSLETSREDPVHYTAQAQAPPPGYVQGGPQPVVYLPMHTHAQYGSPPAYDSYYQQDNRGIPYKS